METALYVWLIYTALCAVFPAAYVARARFLRMIHLTGFRPIFMFSDLLPMDKLACSVWVYGARCIVLNRRTALYASHFDLQQALRHEIGHFVMGHARFNTLMCAAGLWFLLPLFKARQEREAEAFSIGVRVPEVEGAFR